jgi:hypothetical protein
MISHCTYSTIGKYSCIEYMNNTDVLHSTKLPGIQREPIYNKIERKPFKIVNAPPRGTKPPKIPPGPIYNKIETSPVEIVTPNGIPGSSNKIGNTFKEKWYKPSLNPHPIAINAQPYAQGP